MKVYIAAPWELAAEGVRLGARMNKHGWVCTSRWLDVATMGCVDNPAPNVPPDSVAARKAAEDNDEDIDRADAVLMLTAPKLGAESFCEARYALSQRIPVVWVGPRFALSAFRAGVLRCETPDEAFKLLEQLAAVPVPEHDARHIVLYYAVVLGKLEM